MSKLYTADRFVTIGGTTAQYVTGTGSLVTFPAIPSGADYIQNQIASAQSANMWISGNVKATGDFEQTGNNVFVNTSYDMYLQTNASGTGIIFRTSGATERMRITSTGNVGIGTTSAFSKVEIAGAATSWANSPAITFTDNAGTVNSRRWLIGNVATDYGSLNFAVSTTNSDNPTNPKMTITKEGNVGIGTTSPSQKLTIGDGTATGNQYLRINGAGSDIYIGQSVGTLLGISPNSGGLIINDNAYPLGVGTILAQPLIFGTNSTERMRITSGGNVGIGTTSPDTFNQSVNAPHLVIGNGGNATGITLYSGISNQATINFAKGTTTTQQYDGQILYVPNSGSPYMDFRVNSSNAMRITSSGNVGIGTASPFSNAKLQIRPTSDVNIAFQPSTVLSSGGKINAFNDAANVNVNLEINGLNLAFNTGETERMRITSSGNVGIGTSSPGQLLTLSGLENPQISIVSNNTAGNSEVYFGDPGAVYRGAIIYAHNGDSLNFHTAASEKMRITSAGNVGIGTSSPDYKLDVSGITRTSNDVSNRGGTLISTKDIGGAVYLYNDNGSNTGAVRMMSSYLNGGTLYNPNFSIDRSTNSVAYGGNVEGLTYVSSLVIDGSSGNVGIGTTSPQVKLSVQGAQNNTIAPANGVVKFVGGDAGIFMGTLAGTPNYGSWIQSMRESDGLTFHLHLQPNGGSVGIGTTSPAYKLDVDGTGRFSSDLYSLFFKVTDGYGMYKPTSNTLSLVAGGVIGLTFDGASGATATFSSSVTTGGDILVPYNSSDQFIGARFSGTYYNGFVLNGTSRATGIVSRSGDATDYIWFGTNSATERMRITNAGNVGIGTSVPATRFDVQLATNKHILFHNGNGEAEILGATDNGSAYAPLFISASPLVLNVNNGSNVGIGTTSPTLKFEVDNTTTGEQCSLGIVADSTPGITNLSSKWYGNINNSIKFHRGGDATGGEMSFWTTPEGGSLTERVRIQSSGYVGIGTSSPGAKLNIAGPLGSTVGGGGSSIKMTNTDTGNFASISAGIVGIANAGMEFSVGGNRAAVINVSGNVGIGTTSPAVKLDVNGSINLSNGENLTWGGSYGAGIPTIVGYNDGSGGSLYFYPSGNTSGLKMLINSSGNVGIGTSSPSYLLSLSTALTGTTPGSNTALMLESQAAGRDVNIRFGDSVNASGRIGYLSGDLYMYTNGSERMRITNAGNVGIGTTSPGALLDVNGDALISGLTIGQGPVTGQGNTALGDGALGSMVGGKANIAVGSNANSDNDVTGLTVIGVDLNVNPAGSALTQNSLVIGQYNTLNYSTQYPHIYAPDKVNCPNGNTTTDIIAVDYSIYTAIFMEYSIFNSAGDEFRAGTYTAAFKGTGTVVEDDKQTVVYSGTTLAATFTTSISGSVATIQLRNQDSDTYDIRVTARLLMR